MARNTKIIAADDTLRRTFPKDIAPPQLLFDFAAWLSQRTKRELGYYTLKPRSPSDYVPAGVPVEDDLALFFRLSEGSAAGLWFGETRDPDAAPFVVMGSEGGLSIYAPNLACMLHRMAIDALEEDYIEEDFAFRANKATVTAELLDWLKAHPVAWPIIEATQPADYFKCDDKSADRWLRALVDAHENARLSDPDLSAIAQILQDLRYLPKALDLDLLGRVTLDDMDTPGRRYHAVPLGFRVFAAGDRFRIFDGMAMVPAAAHLLEKVRPGTEERLHGPILSLRDRFAADNKGEGLWPSARLSVSLMNGVDLDPIYSHGYPMGYEGFPPEAFAADQARYPRAKRKLAAWHKELLDAAK